MINGIELSFGVMNLHESEQRLMRLLFICQHKRIGSSLKRIFFSHYLLICRDGVGVSKKALIRFTLLDYMDNPTLSLKKRHFYFFNLAFQNMLLYLADKYQINDLSKIIILLGIVLLRFHCAKTQLQKTQVFNAHAFQRTQVSQERESNPKVNLYHRASDGYKTSTPNIQTSPREIYAQGDTTYVSGNYKFSYAPNSQVPNSSTSSDARKPNFSFAQNLQNQQHVSNEDSPAPQIENLERSLKNSPEGLYQKTQARVNFSKNDEWNAHTAYSSDKSPLENTTVGQQKNTAHDSNLHFEDEQSKRVQKVPIVLITIQKGQNSQPKQQTNSNSKIKNEKLNNGLKYNKNHTIVQGNSFSYYPSIQIDISKEQTELPNKSSFPNQAHISPFASKNVVYSSMSTNNNALQYSIPQTMQYSRILDWRPMDRSNFQHFESKMKTSSYKEQENNPELRTYSHENQQNSPVHANPEHGDQIHSKLQNFPLQQSDRYQPFETKSAINSDLENYFKVLQNESTVKTYGDIHMKDGQQNQISFRQLEGHAYPQNHSSNSITSILHRKLNFQNVTFPINKENQSHVVPQILSETLMQTDKSHLNSHLDNAHKYSKESKVTDFENQNLNQETQFPKQNYNYFTSNNNKNLVDQSHTLSNQQMKIGQFHVVKNDGRTSRTEMVNDFQVTPMPELRSNSQKGYQDVFGPKGADILPSNSGEYEHSPNQNVQEQNIKQNIFVRTPTNKKFTHNSGYVIFPLDDKYTVQNDGDSGKRFSLVLDQLSTAYNPVKKLFMLQNADSSGTNSRGFFRSSHEETGNKALHGDEVSDFNQKSIYYINYDYNAPQKNPSSSDIKSPSFSQGNGHFSSGSDSNKSSPENIYIASDHTNSKSGKPRNVDHNEAMIRQINYGMFQQHDGKSRESSEEQVGTFINFPIQYAQNFQSPFKNINDKLPETSEFHVDENTKSEKNTQQYQASHSEYMKHNSNEGTKEHSLKFMKENQNSEIISSTYDEKTGTSYSNSHVRKLNKQSDENINSKEFQVSSREIPNFKTDFNKHKTSHSHSRFSSPQALLLVLVSEKSSYLNDKSNTDDISSEYVLDTHSKDISELLREESNTKSLLESLYSASSKNIKQKKPANSNKGTSSRHRKN
ncbi:hypothetical protein HNY73_002121 [Argiope bruennichi]|uniref:Uncharacterized protein n=1 Tax=Argiope bruennichi TaxID=94029 RepID=A0A8T0FWT4_ARGBR|nr:hypothetical protein HNY73_002121 [Argiope bruennichi]